MKWEACSLFHDLFKNWSTEFGLSCRALAFIVLLPLIVPPAYLLLLNLPVTDQIARASLRENNLIETLTFLVMLTGGGAGLRYARSLRAVGEPLWVCVFFGLFSIGLLLTAMEEISWGQSLLGFETPEWFKEINVQGETTLHNMVGIHDIRDQIKFAYAFGGVIGCLIAYVRCLNRVAVAPMLICWFLVIGFWTMLEIVVPRESEYYFVADSIAELTELLIGLSAVLYLALHKRRLNRMSYDDHVRRPL